VGALVRKFSLASSQASQVSRPPVALSLYRRVRGGTSYACPYRQRALARIEGSTLIPLAQLPDRLPELDPAAETVVVCHHGARSAYATRGLDQIGFAKVLNLEGGLDAYADLDESMPRY
jgi:rhodanese-like protein